MNYIQNGWNYLFIYKFYLYNNYNFYFYKFLFEFIQKGFFIVMFCYKCIDDLDLRIGVIYYGYEFYKKEDFFICLDFVF